MTRRWRLVVVATVLAGLVVAVAWFQPQVLLFDRVVDEDLPASTVAATAPPPSGRAPSPLAPPATASPRPQPERLRVGGFSSRSRYTVEGRAALYRLADGRRVVRLEEFSSTNGPDLFVYLSAGSSADADPELAADIVDLGRLKGNRGNQNYAVPAGVDLARYDTVVIWCRRFTVGFGAADLLP